MPAVTDAFIRSAIKSHKLIMKKLEAGLITEDDICTRCLSRQKGPGLRFFCKKCFREVSSSSSNNDGDFTYYGMERFGASHYEKHLKSPRQKSSPKSLLKNSPPKNSHQKATKKLTL